MRGGKLSHGSMAILTGFCAAIFLYLGLFQGEGVNILNVVVGVIWLVACICHTLASKGR